MSKRRPTQYHAVAFALVALAAALGAALIPGRELWLDEAHSAYVAPLPLSGVGIAIRGDVHPPMYFLLLHGWVRTLGTSPMALRGFSLLCMVCAVVVLWRVARTEDGEVPGLIALAFAAVSPALLVYAVEIRMYALLVLTYSLTLLFQRRASLSRTSVDAALAGMAAAAAIYTHYVALFAVAGLFVAWIALDLRAHRSLKTCAVACSVCAILVLPWVPTIVLQRQAKASLDTRASHAKQDTTALAFTRTAPVPPSQKRHAAMLTREIASVVGVYPARSTSVLVLLALPFAVIVVLTLRRAFAGDEWILLLLCASTVMLTGVWLLGVSGRRFVLILAPTTALIIARISAERRSAYGAFSWRVTVAAALVVSLAGSIRLLHLPRPTPLTELISFLRSESGARDQLLFHAPYGQVLFDYYALREGLTLRGSGFPSSTAAWWERQRFQGWGSPVPTHRDLDSTVAALHARAADAPDLWLILFEPNFYDPSGRVLARLSSEGRKIQQWQSADSSWTAVHFRFGDGRER